VSRRTPSNKASHRFHDDFALRIAAIVVAVSLSFSFIAAIMFLPIRVLALQAIPILTALVIAMYLFLDKVEEFEPGRDENG